MKQLSNQSNAELILADAIIRQKRQSLQAADKALKDEHERITALLISRKFQELATPDATGTLALFTVKRLDQKALLADAEQFGIYKDDYQIETDSSRLTTKLLRPVTFELTLAERK